VSTPEAVPGMSASQDLQRIGIIPEEAKQEVGQTI
jgi:hypothetical protein